MLDELKNAIETQGQAFADFKARIDADLDKHAKAIADVQRTIGRPNVAGDSPGDREAKQRIDAFLRKGVPFETKAMEAGSDPDGGYLVPKLLDTAIRSVMTRYSPVRRVARVVATESADFRIVIAKTLPGASWAGETGARAATTSPELGAIDPPGGDLYGNIQLTQQVIDDSKYDLENVVIGQVGAQFAISEGAAFVSGSGLAQPKGFLSGPAPVTTSDATRTWGTLQYVATGQSGAFATTNPADKLIELMYTLAPPYRANATWLMSSDTLQLVRQFKDENKHYLWEPSSQAGEPSRLFGVPVLECVDMPTVAANSFSVAIGDFERGYVITDRYGTRMLRDPYSNKPYIGLYAWRRTGGCVVDSNAIKLLKFAAS